MIPRRYNPIAPTKPFRDQAANRTDAQYSTWVVLLFRVFFFIRVPYYSGDPKGDPNLENYPYDLKPPKKKQPQQVGPVQHEVL